MGRSQMDENSNLSCAFFTHAFGQRDLAAVCTLQKSLRIFGGRFRDAALHVFIEEGMDLSGFRPDAHSELHALSLEPPFREYPFAGKVRAAAFAADIAEAVTGQLVWLDPSAVLLRPPLLFLLSGTESAAMRPVHIRNVSSEYDVEPDEYWSAIFEEVGLDHRALQPAVSFVDNARIRPNFNCGAFSMHAPQKFFRAWWDHFARLVCDDGFQKKACRTPLHKLFLHQCVFSALLSREFPAGTIRMLPPEYGYPLHFHARLAVENRHMDIDRLVCMLAYPEDISDAEKSSIFSTCSPSLRAWLMEHALQP